VKAKTNARYSETGHPLLEYFKTNASDELLIELERNRGEDETFDTIIDCIVELQTIHLTQLQANIEQYCETAFNKQNYNMHKFVKEKMRYTDKKIEHSTDIGKMLKKSLSSIHEV